MGKLRQTGHKRQVESSAAHLPSKKKRKRSHPLFRKRHAAAPQHHQQQEVLESVVSSGFVIMAPKVIGRVFFKPCKKREKFYEESMPPALLKKPYKYNFKLQKSKQCHRDLSKCKLSIKLCFEDGEAVQAGGLQNAEQWTWNKDDSSFVVGPVFFTVCSYKLQNRLFKLLFELRDEQGFSICQIVSKSFAIRAKRPRSDSKSPKVKARTPKQLPPVVEKLQKSHHRLQSVQKKLPPIHIPIIPMAPLPPASLPEVPSPILQQEQPINPFVSDSEVIHNNKFQAERILMEYHANNDRFTPIHSQLPVFEPPLVRSQEYYFQTLKGKRLLSPFHPSNQSASSLFSFDEDPFAFVE